MPLIDNDYESFTNYNNSIENAEESRENAEDTLHPKDKFILYLKSKGYSKRVAKRLATQYPTYWDTNYRGIFRSYSDKRYDMSFGVPVEKPELPTRETGIESLLGGLFLVGVAIFIESDICIFLAVILLVVSLISASFDDTIPSEYPKRSEIKNLEKFTPAKRREIEKENEEIFQLKTELHRLKNKQNTWAWREEEILNKKINQKEKKLLQIINVEIKDSVVMGDVNINTDLHEHDEDNQ